MHKAGDRVGAYELLNPLGAGGFGSVWLARAPNEERDVAIKILHRDMLETSSKDKGPTIVDRFLAEARIIARLNHAGLVQIYDLVDDRQNGVVAYVMEKLEGCDLTKIDDRLDLETLLDVLAEVADTLTFLHSQGVIHRDVTPRNIFVCDPTAGAARPCRVKLLDFGTAKELYATQRIAQTGTGVLLGALRSMAPESFLPKTTPTPAIDQWGLGVAIYTCLTGRAPFDNVSLSELVRQIEQDAPAAMKLLPRFNDGAGVVRDIQAIVFRLLAKQPELRFSAIQEAAKALRAVAYELAEGSERTIFDPARVTTEPTATPASMHLSPSLKLAQVMVSRKKQVLPDGAEDTIPAPPPTRPMRVEALDPIEGVTARFDAPPPEPTVLAKTQLSIDTSDLRPTEELETQPPGFASPPAKLEKLEKLEKKETSVWLRRAMVLLLMLAAAAIGYYGRELAAQLGR